MASTDSRPVPIRATAFRAVFAIYDADGDLVTGAAGLDSEVSKDQGAFADCTNEATEIATSSGMYYLDLTSTEMTADCTAVIVKTSTTGAKTTVMVFYPQESGDIKVDVQSLLGTAWLTPGTAGTPDVNVKLAAGTAWASGAITAAVFASDAITAAKVASDVADEIWAKLCTEPTAVVGANPTAIAALSWLLTLSRNKITQTATTQILKADDGSTTVATSTVSDDATTFTRGEFA